MRRSHSRVVEEHPCFRLLLVIGKLHFGLVHLVLRGECLAVFFRRKNAEVIEHECAFVILGNSVYPLTFDAVAWALHFISAVQVAVDEKVVCFGSPLHNDQERVLCLVFEGQN